MFQNLKASHTIETRPRNLKPKALINNTLMQILNGNWPQNCFYCDHKTLHFIPSKYCSFSASAKRVRINTFPSFCNSESIAIKIEHIPYSIIIIIISFGILRPVVKCAHPEHILPADGNCLHDVPKGISFS